MSTVTLLSPYRTYRGTDKLPHDTGNVIYPRGTKHFARACTLPTPGTGNVINQVKASMTSIGQAWQTVSDANAAAWQVLADAMNPLVDKDGNPYNIAGQRAYMAVNAHRHLDGQATTDTAPEYVKIPYVGLKQVIWDPWEPALVIRFKEYIDWHARVAVAVSKINYSAVRKPRRNEIATWTFPTSDSTSDDLWTWNYFYIPLANRRWDLTPGNRYGFRLAWLSVDYVPGPVAIEKITLEEAEAK